MYVLKGEKSFSILNITGEDMAMLYDGFNSYRNQLTGFLKMSSDEFKKAFSANAEKEQAYRKLFKERVKTLGNEIKKMQKFTEGG